MEREERSERSATRDVAKVRREVNKDNIVFLLDPEQKVILKFSELQIF